MTKETDVLQDDSMNEVNGGIGRPFEKAKRRKTIICPQCGAVIEAYTTGIVEGQGMQVIYRCNTCSISWAECMNSSGCKIIAVQPDENGMFGIAG